MQDFSTLIEVVARLEERVVMLTKSFDEFRIAFYAKKEKPGWIPVAGIVSASIFSWLSFLTWAIIRIARPG
jgi:hypothetical protein